MSRKNIKTSPDDITSYFDWKNSIEQHEFLEVDKGENEVETATGLSRRLSIIPGSAPVS